MGSQSFTNQGDLGDKVESPEAAPDGASLPSFRPVSAAAKGAAAQRALPIPAPTTKPSVDKKHFIAREDHRVSRLAPATSPSLMVEPSAVAAERPPEKNRLAALMRSSLILLIGAGLGYASAYILPGPIHLAGREIARAPSERKSGDDLSALIDKAERQIAEHRLETPLGDNALETYRRIAARSPGSLEMLTVGEHLSLALWSLGAAAMQRGDWAEATRYFDIIKTLPVPRSAPASTGTPSPEPAPDGDKPHAAVATDAADATAPANNLSFAAPSTAPLKDERTREAAVVALRRGDEAMRFGDIVSARRFYEFAASSGIAAAATAVGQTYDPLYLKSAGVRGVKASPETARFWYEKAARQGDARAVQLLQSLDQN
jgi:TPR repeat protein